MAQQATEEQLLYANILNKGMMFGLLGLVITFIIYGAGILKPMIPIEQVQLYWVMSVGDYLNATPIHTGWWWLGNINKGDMLTFVPIAFLSLLTIICYAAIIPGLLRKKDTTYVALVVIEIIVLSVAASGLLGSGGH